MKDRAEAAARLARVRAGLARVAQWRRIASERHLATLADAQGRLDEFVADGLASAGLARLALAQAGRLEAQVRHAAAARDAQAAAQMEAERARKLADTMAERLARLARHGAERAALERLIEEFAAAPPTPPTSLP